MSRRSAGEASGFLADVITTCDERRANECFSEMQPWLTECGYDPF